MMLNEVPLPKHVLQPKWGFKARLWQLIDFRDSCLHVVTFQTHICVRMCPGPSRATHAAYPMVETSSAPRYTRGYTAWAGRLYFANSFNDAFRDFARTEPSMVSSCRAVQSLNKGFRRSTSLDVCRQL